MNLNTYSGDKTMFDLSILFAPFFALLAIFVVFMGVKTIPQGHEYTVERFGKYTQTLLPGLNFIIPFVDRISSKINMREQVLDIEKQSVISKDNAVVQSDGVVFFQIVDAAKSFYEVNHLRNAMRNLCLTNIRTVLGAMSLDEMLSNREEINTRLLTVVDQATNPWGVKVTRIEIKDLEPPHDLVEAMSRQMKAERQKRADILGAEGQRQSEILRAEGEKQGAILDAEGRKEAAYRDAEARERLAEAEANATRMVSDAVRDGDIQALNYFVATKYTEALQAIASADNQKLVLMPLEASALIGSLGGIGELAKGILDKE
jgi:regulator of protease activity HflC (stomatin/prohibitin superfamily)